MIIKKTTRDTGRNSNCREEIMWAAKRYRVDSYVLYVPRTFDNLQVVRLRSLNALLGKYNYPSIEFHPTKIKDRAYRNARFERYNNLNNPVDSWRFHIPEELGKYLPAMHAFLGYVRGDRESLFELALDMFTSDTCRNGCTMKHPYPYSGILSFLLYHVDPRWAGPYYEKHFEELVRFNSLTLISLAVRGIKGQPDYWENDTVPYNIYGRQQVIDTQIRRYNFSGNCIEYRGTSYPTYIFPDYFLDRLEYPVG